MGKSLLIVESPTKAKTLGRYLGQDFIVKASVGHIKDLPKNKLGIDLEMSFKPDYGVIRGKGKVLKELSEAASNSDVIFLGPDPDREGEAIAWHIAEEICTKDKPVYRVLFYELTQKAIQEALSDPHTLNKSLYEAQQARRILDRLVGYQISPILWEKVKRGLSAGRVQSVALRLICEREAEIWRFDAEEYWTIEALLSVVLDDAASAQGSVTFKAHLLRYRKKKCKIVSREDAQRLVDQIKPLPYLVSQVDRKKKHRNPAPPFTTSTLQQEAARRLRFSAKQTMRLAQRLYEGVDLGDEGAVGLITYMRTDSTRLSQEAVKASRDYISQVWGKDYLPAKPVVYKAKQGAQDAHEAIRPTDVGRTPQLVASHLGKEELKLYTLVWKRFVACQMAPAVINQTSVDITAGDYTFRSTGSIIEFPGFMALYVESLEDGETAGGGDEWLPDLVEGQPLGLRDIISKQHFTQPPPRFSEASLIKELEDQGIGRPSTYATIISTILEREYVTVQKLRLFPTELGWLINKLLVENFPGIVDVEFTAKMEKSLDEIENGRYAYLDLLSEFYEQFAKTLASAQTNMLNLKSVGWPTELQCPQCERSLFIRLSRNGPFIACSGYPECSFSSDYQRDEKGHIQLLKAASTGETCEKCGLPMVLKRGRFGVFLACSGYPQCKNTRSPSMGVPCPREGCGGEIVERVTRKGRRFYGCNRYPECKTVFWDKPVAKACPSCGSSFLLEKQSKRSGVKRVCSNPSCDYQEKDQCEIGTETV